jgi:hypothetical protein
MTSADLLPAAVLQRKAVVYIRQSTQQQVQTNRESRRRQYSRDDKDQTHCPPVSGPVAGSCWPATEPTLHLETVAHVQAR